LSFQPNISQINEEISQINIFLKKNTGDLGINQFSDFQRFDTARQKLGRDQNDARDRLVILEKELAIAVNNQSIFLQQQQEQEQKLATPIIEQISDIQIMELLEPVPVQPEPVPLISEPIETKDNTLRNIALIGGALLLL